MFYSPLRYPGGKNKIANFVEKICADNSISEHYIEPYAGGAAIALHLLIEEKIEKITLNDLDKSIYSFWWSVLNETDKLCNLIDKTDINLESWKRMKEVQSNKENASLLNLGFSTLFLNRTNFSGIINAKPIGGLKQKGEYKINCRFNKVNLINRIKRISAHKNRINLYNMDAIDLIKKNKRKKSLDTLLYLDPPYYLNGPELYFNSYSNNNHKELAREIKNMEKINWIISYDDQKEVKKLYNWVDKDRKVEFYIQHSANKTKRGREVMFFSKTFNKLNFSFLRH